MRTVPLNEIATIVSGATPSTSVAAYWGGDIPWVTPADLTDHEGIYFRGQPKCITDKGFNRCSAAMLPRGSILFSSRAPIGHCAVLDYAACTNQGFKSIIPSERLDPIYGFFALKFLTPSIVAKGRGATFAEINKEIMEEVEIPYCDLSEQCRIARLLERADHHRRTRRYAFQISDQFLPASFRKIFGDPTTQARRWPHESLGALVRPDDKINYGVVQPGTEIPNGVPIIRVADMDDFDSSLPHLKKVTSEIDQRHSASRLNGDEILIACVGATLGKIACARPSMEGFNIARAVARVPGDWRKINSAFLTHYLLSPRVQKFWKRETRTVGQPTLNILQIEETPVILPPLSMQEQFAALVAQHKRLRGTYVEGLRQADHLFQTLLHQAFGSK
jgi:type I restriction enzyme, S subunit